MSTKRVYRVVMYEVTTPEQQASPEMVDLIEVETTDTAISRNLFDFVAAARADMFAESEAAS